MLTNFTDVFFILPMNFHKFSKLPAEKSVRGDGLKAMDLKTCYLTPKSVETDEFSLRISISKSLKSISLACLL